MSLFSFLAGPPEEERETIPLCLDQGLAVIPWSPLARGFLTGTRNREGGSTVRAGVDTFAKAMYYREADFKVQEAVANVATRRGVSSAQIACAWILQAPGVTSPIIGATKPRHVQELISAVDIKLDAEEIAALEAHYQPHPILGHAQPSPKDMRG